MVFGLWSNCNPRKQITNGEVKKTCLSPDRKMTVASTMILQSLVDNLKAFFIKHQHAAKAALGVTLVLLSFGTRKIALKLRYKIKKYPPVHVGIPYFGSMFSMAWYGADFTNKILPSYGPITMHFVGSVHFTIIHEIHLMQEILKFTLERPIKAGSIYQDPQCLPFAMCNQDQHAHIRRNFLHKGLVQILNSQNLNIKINEILTKITFKKLDNIALNNQIWEPRSLTRNTTFNVMFSAIFNKFIPDTSPKFELYDKTIRKHLESGLPLFFGVALPLFKNISFVQNASKNYMQTHDQLMDWMKQDLEESMINFDNNAMKNSDSYSIDETKIENIFSHKLFYYYVIKSMQEIGESDVGLAKRRLQEDLLAMIIAGMDTTAHTLEVGVCLLAKYPQIQEMLYQVEFILSTWFLFCFCLL